MTDLQLHIKPCPYCGAQASIEKALYDSERHQINDPDKRIEWIAKCPDCGARTEYQPTRLSAIIAWNRQQFNGMTKILHLPRNTQSTEPYEQLAGAIFRVAFDDYKDAYKAKLMKHEPGAPKGEHVLVKSVPYLEQRARDEAKYDIWRDRMNCTHCAAKPHQCRHKTGDYWREFKHGTAPLCIKDELVGDDTT